MSVVILKNKDTGGTFSRHFPSPYLLNRFLDKVKHGNNNLEIKAVWRN